MVQNNRPKTRKEIRKEQRKQKKQRREEYYTNRSKKQQVGKFVRHPSKLEETGKLSCTQQTNKPEKIADVNVQDEQLREIQKEKKVQRELEKRMKKQRKDLLKKANEDEDRNIKQLEKQLHLNKRKSKSMPQSFLDDGLGYLLEMCDSNNMKSVATAEREFDAAKDDFEEDLALMTADYKKPSTHSHIDVDDSHSENSDNDLLTDNDEIEDQAIHNEDSEDETNNYDEENSSSAEDGSCVIDEDDFGSESDDKIKSESHKSGVSADEKSTKTNSKRKLKSHQQSEKTKKIKVGSEFSSDSEELSVSNESEEEIGDDHEGTDNDETWEDIYGRIRAKDGSIVVNNAGKYIPPAIRAKMEAEMSEDKKREEKLLRLKKQLKGLLNRLAESNMHNISVQIEQLYMNNSRNDMNESMTSLILESLVSHVLTPERLLLEHVMLITILHANVGSEVGAHFLQTSVKMFEELYAADYPVENKCLDNVVHVIAQLYNFKVFDAQLLHEILNKLSRRFSERDVECILLVLKGVGFTLRKDNPLALKELIMNLQKQALTATEEVKDNPRVKFMLDILLAIKNNNMSKIPNYDTSYSEHLKKMQKGIIRKGYYVTTLNISLEDLLKADERGKWWVVGSAWTGKSQETNSSEQTAKSHSFSEKILKLARKQRMNTDSRRQIFCILMTSEDYLDAFEKLLKLELKNQQEREIIHVILHCCLQEKTFNPYYSVLAEKFCSHDRKFQMTIKYSIWDKLKSLNDCSAVQISNLAKLLTHLFLEKSLPISTLKVIEFSELDNVTLRFLRQVLIGILLSDDPETCQGVFEKVGTSDDAKTFAERLKLFIQHCLVQSLSSDSIPEKQKVLKERIGLVEKVLSVGKKKMKF